jgi:predicted acyl esterase
VHPFNHSCTGSVEPINFENGTLLKEFGNYKLKWFESIRKSAEPPFEKGKITYYKLFEGKWCCDGFFDAKETKRYTLGEESVTYKYNPYAPATVKGGLSTNFDGNAWQNEPNSRYDVISVFTPEFEEDTFIKGRIKAKLKVSSDCEDTCFYMRLSIPKEEGYYGLRDDINQISNFDAEYKPNSEIEMSFSFDEHAFVVKKGEKLRIDISSSAYPNYVPHTNQKGLFSENTTARVATNTVYLQESYIELPIRKDC